VPNKQEGQSTEEQKKVPPPPKQRKLKAPPRMPERRDERPPLKKAGRGKIWAGIVIIIVGFILTFVVFRGMSFLPLIGVAFIFIGVYAIYKGFTDVDQVLTPETKKGAKKKKTEMVYKKKKTLNKGMIFLVVIFIFFALPIFLTVFQFGNISGQPYSAYNTFDGGCSVFRDDIEAMGYQTAGIISGYGELTKFPADYPLNRTLLFVIGPKSLFFPTGLIYLQDLLDAGGRVCIFQDQGTANEAFMMLGIWGAVSMLSGGQMHTTPLDAPFQDGYLCQGVGGTPDAADLTLSLSIAGGSYNVRCWTVSPIGGTLSSFSVVDTTSDTIWLDLNKNLVRDPEDVTQTGGYGVTAVGMTGQIVIIGDPDILTNKLMLQGAYQNRAFASALVNSLTGGDHTWLIVFDEAHQVKLGTNASFYYGLIIAMEDFLLLSWLFTPLGPYLAYRLVKKFIPEAEKPEKRRLSRVEREGESLYAKRLSWFKRRGRYEKALSLLYRRLKRTITTTLRLRGFAVDDAINEIIGSYPEGGVDEKRLAQAFKTFEEVEKGKRIAFESEFLKIFLEMRWVADLAAPR
jgi:hypothetical protein